MHSQSVEEPQVDLSKPITSAHRRSKPITSAHRRSKPITSAHRRSNPITSAHRRSKPITSAHRRSKPITSAHRRSKPITSAHRRSKPITSAHRRSKPITSAHRRPLRLPRLTQACKCPPAPINASPGNVIQYAIISEPIWSPNITVKGFSPEPIHLFIRPLPSSIISGVEMIGETSVVLSLWPLLKPQHSKTPDAFSNICRVNPFNRLS